MNRNELVVCGRVIGVYKGWDHIEEDHSVYYGFEANPGINLPSADLNVDYAKGLFQYYRDNGTINIEFDIIETLKDLPRQS